MSWDWNIFIDNDLEYSFASPGECVRQLRQDVDENGEEYVRRKYELQILRSDGSVEFYNGQKTLDWAQCICGGKRSLIAIRVLCPVCNRESFPG